MNKQIEKFEKFIDDSKLTAVFEMFEAELQKFAELIVQDLERELAAALAQRDEKDKQLASCYDRMDKAEAQCDKLAVALKKYGEHNCDCIKYITDDKECDCGLDTLLKESGK